MVPTRLDSMPDFLSSCDYVSSFLLSTVIQSLYPFPMRPRTALGPEGQNGFHSTLFRLRTLSCPSSRHSSLLWLRLPMCEGPHVTPSGLEVSDPLQSVKTQRLSREVKVSGGTELPRGPKRDSEGSCEYIPGNLKPNETQVKVPEGSNLLVRTGDYVRDRGVSSRVSTSGYDR